MQLNIDPATASTANAARARINVPLNLTNWAALPHETADRLVWFHQHSLDRRLNGKACAAALGFAGEDGETQIYRVLKGTFEGDWEKLCDRIDDYKRLTLERAGIQRGEFTENTISGLIFAGLDYAMANNSITLIEGESGIGKTICASTWKQDNNHGKTVMVEAPPIGGLKQLLRVIAGTQGSGRKDSTQDMLEACANAFNPHRMLIIDQADRLLPRNGKYAEKLDVLHYLYDRCGMALGLLCTSRLRHEMEGNAYQFEQVLGRIGMPIRLPSKVEADSYRPLVVQYYPRPSDKLMALAEQISNNALPRQKGHFRTLNQTLRIATRLHSKEREKNARARLNEDHFFKAAKMRAQMLGEIERREIRQEAA